MIVDAYDVRAGVLWWRVARRLVISIERITWSPR